MKRLIVSIFAFGLGSSFATASTVPADNSAVNGRDRRELTAGDQSNERSDLEITRKIRRAITGRKGLSTYARNIKIVTDRGVVTLKGPVRTAEEKSVVERYAISIAGRTNVRNEMDITPAE